MPPFTVKYTGHAFGRLGEKVELCHPPNALPFRGGKITLLLPLNMKSEFSKRDYALPSDLLQHQCQHHPPALPT